MKKTALKLSLVTSLLLGAANASALDAVTSFGTNPGKLQMFRYAPNGLPHGAPLVVVLHGCTQGANDMANAGWNTVADAMKFYVAYPQQPTANNPVSCFDWFGQYNNPADKTNITRGGGEAESIKEMVDKMKADFSIDAKRVYVAGFSAGAAMAAVMVATYPDVFAAGAMAAAVPYDCPSTQNADVFQCMNPGKQLSPDQWGGFVRNAFAGFSGPWPRISIWQGTQDTTVGTENSVELVKQWTNVHGIGTNASAQDTVAGFPHSVFKSSSGQIVVERYEITGMAHGFPVDAANGCGTSSTYTPDEKICAARRMADFFLGGASVGGDGGAGGGGGGGGDPGTGSGGGSGPNEGAPSGDDAGACPAAETWSYATHGGCAMGGTGRDAGAIALVVVGLAAVLRRRRG